MGLAYRRGVGGLTGTVSFRLNLLSQVQSLGQGRGAAQGSGNTGSASRGARPNRFGRMLYRWHLLGSKKRGHKVGVPKRGKGTKLMVIADAAGLPLAVYTALAHPHEVTLVQSTLAETLTLGRPRRLIGDRAYDSDPLDQALASQGIELIAPHRVNRHRKATQDGRALRRYHRRWKIERLFAWLNKYKRVITRWDRCHERFAAFVHLALSLILLRRVQAFMK